MSETTNDNPSLMLEWLRVFEQRRAAIGEAIRALDRHCQELQPPQTADDTEALLNWRRRVFQIFSAKPCVAEGRQRVAEAVAKEIQSRASGLIAAFEQVLHSIEVELTRAASRGEAGLINAQSLPAHALRREFGQYFVCLDGLPHDHPLAVAIADEDRLSDRRVRLGDVVRTAMRDGTTRIDPPDWHFLPDLVGECQARKAEGDRQAEAAWRQQQEETRRREKISTPSRGH
jgi:hypothetical protein